MYTFITGHIKIKVQTTMLFFVSGVQIQTLKGAIGEKLCLHLTEQSNATYVMQDA